MEKNIKLKKTPQKPTLKNNNLKPKNVKKEEPIIKPTPAVLVSKDEKIEILKAKDVNKRTAIEDKKENFINISENDTTVIAELSSRIIDFSSVISTKDDSFIKFINKEDLELTLINLEKRKSDEELKKVKDIQSLKNVIKRYNLKNLTSAQENLLRMNFKEAWAAYKPIFEGEGLTYRKQIEEIKKRVDLTFKEIGIWKLYLGTVILYGKTKKGFKISTPLVFYPVEIQLGESSDLKLIHKEDTKPIINEKLLIFLKKEYNLDWNTNEMIEYDISTIIKFISRDLGVALSFSQTAPEWQPNKIISAESLNTSVEITEDVKTQLYLFNSVILGEFTPSTSALSKDLVKLVEMKWNPFEKIGNYSPKKYIKDEVKDSDLLISVGRPLNLYQKYAVRASLEQDTLIYGPPGTGKSETISNIIANVLIRNKNILVCSEKMAALEVLEDRLDDIKNLCLNLYDLESKIDFYDSLYKMYDEIGMFWTKNEIDEYKDNRVISLKEKLVNKSFVQEYKNKRQKMYEIFENLEFLYTKNENNINFFDFIQSKLNNENIITNRKIEDDIGFIKLAMDQYNIRSVSELFKKVEEWNNFTLIHNINSEEALNKLKKEKLILTEIESKYQILRQLKTKNQNFIKGINVLSQIISNYNLEKNQNFINSIQDNKSFLNDMVLRFNEWKAENQILVEDNNLFRWVLTNKEVVRKVVTKYKTLKTPIKKQAFANSFLKNLNIKEIDLKNEDIIDKQWETKFKSICEFIEKDVDPFGVVYVFDKNINLFTNRVIFTYFNQWILKPYVQELLSTDLLMFDSETTKSILEIAENEAYLTRLKYIIISEDETMIKNRSLFSTNLNDELNVLSKSEKELAENSAKIILSSYYENIRTKLVNLTDEEKIKVKEMFQVAKQDNKFLPPVREFVSQYSEQLKLLFPIWISRPEYIAEMTPLKQGLFDYGIFDEASQIFLENAYPILYRSQISIIAGDDKQLKPTSFFNANSSNAKATYEMQDMDKVESLLDRAKVALWSSFHLKNHYRSVDKELIKFSSDNLYNGNLQFASFNGTKDTGLEVINVNGVWSDVNKQEAEKVIELLEQNVDKYEKIVIITFNARQSAYIESLIQKQNPQGLVFEKLLNEKIVVTNLENVQGNEGDLVILSVTYGFNEEGKISNNYGPLMQDGGLNRLNVAITRAKYKMIVVKSLNADDMTINIHNPNSLCFKRYIEFLDNLDEYRKKEIELTNHTRENSLLHKNIYNELRRIILYTGGKFKLIENFSIGSEVLNFSIQHVESQKSALVIKVLEVDKFNGISKVSLMQDLDKINFIKSRGYPTFAIFAHEWLNDSDSIITKINNIIVSFK